MRSSLRRSLALRVRSALCAAIVVVAPASAFAQTGATEAGAGKGAIVEAKTESGYAVWFPVDNLAGGGHDPLGDVMKGGPRAVRCPLMRPRLQFVPEMLKSVETL
jgi:hypothetical protein